MSWLSLHVFYTGSLTPMLVECVDPLVRTLRDRGLIQRYFFIRYWLEGPHLRLRLLPTPGVSRRMLTDVVEVAVGAFLRRRPALYQPDYPGADEHYRELGMAEYGERWWTERFGPSGTMPFRPINTIHYMTYEREYERYGGPAGMDLAEWHFEHSSDYTLRLCATANVHVRPLLLGLGLQHSLAMCLAFLGTGTDVALFMSRYRAFWQGAYNRVPNADTVYAKGLARIADPLCARVADIRAAVDRHRDPADARLATFPDAWIRHGRQLRERVDALFDAGDITLAGRRGEPPPTDSTTVAMLLLSSYLHMANNRLGLAISDEIYLSYLIEHALAPEGVNAGAGTE